MGGPADGAGRKVAVLKTLIAIVEAIGGLSRQPLHTFEYREEKTRLPPRDLGDVTHVHPLPLKASVQFSITCPMAVLPRPRLTRRGCGIMLSPLAV